MPVRKGPNAGILGRAFPRDGPTLPREQGGGRTRGLGPDGSRESLPLPEMLLPDMRPTRARPRHSPPDPSTKLARSQRAWVRIQLPASWRRDRPFDAGPCERHCGMVPGAAVACTLPRRLGGEPIPFYVSSPPSGAAARRHERGPRRRSLPWRRVGLSASKDHGRDRSPPNRCAAAC